MLESPVGFQADADYVEQAVDIIREEFQRGLWECCEDSAVERYYSNFVHESDPIMSPLIEGMKDKKLEKTFVSYSRIYDTISTRTRFWLTASLVKIILLQSKRFGTPVSHVFTRKSLANHGMDWNLTIANMGDNIIENLIGGTGNKKWNVNLDLMAYDKIGELAKEYRRRYDDDLRFSPMYEQDLNYWDLMTRRDQAEIEGVLSHLGSGSDSLGVPTVQSGVPLDCDLLIVSPHKTSNNRSVVAIRFVNPKTFKDKADVIEARQNLLCLKAFLAQEKPERPVKSINTWVCEIVDRNIDRGYPFFSPLTYRNATQFWDGFIKVPFHRVREAIEQIGQQVLAKSLTDLLPS
jgi:hypothetical protein